MWSLGRRRCRGGGGLGRLGAVVAALCRSVVSSTRRPFAPAWPGFDSTVLRSLLTSSAIWRSDFPGASRSELISTSSHAGTTVQMAGWMINSQPSPGAGIHHFTAADSSTDGSDVADHISRAVLALARSCLSRFAIAASGRSLRAGELSGSRLRPLPRTPERGDIARLPEDGRCL